MSTSQPATSGSTVASPLMAITQQLYQGEWLAFTRHWEQWRKQTGLTVIFTPNPEQVIQAEESSAFLTVLLSADVLLPDGVGLVWASHRLWPAQPCQQFAGRKVVEWWFQEASQRQISTFLLGAKPGVAEALAREIDPRQRWCQALMGYRDVRQPSEKEEQTVRAAIETAQPEVLFVAFGAPWQEMWVSEHRDWLARVGVKIVMVCGGALDLLSPATSLRKPPQLIEKLKLEWLYRLLQEPHRWQRQLRLVRFVWSVYRQTRTR